jgi:hypothetical protein
MTSALFSPLILTRGDGLPCGRAARLSRRGPFGAAAGRQPLFSGRRLP